MHISKWMAIGLMLAATPGLAGQVYKWVDPAGSVHYSDQPQPGWKPMTVKTPASAAEPLPPTEGKGASPSRAVASALDCTRKQRELAAYQTSPKIVQRDVFGKEKEFSPEDREKLIALTQQQADQLCAGQPQGSN